MPTGTGLARMTPAPRARYGAPPAVNPVTQRIPCMTLIITIVYDVGIGHITMIGLVACAREPSAVIPVSPSEGACIKGAFIINTGVKVIMKQVRLRIKCSLSAFKTESVMCLDPFLLAFL